MITKLAKNLTFMKLHVEFKVVNPEFKQDYADQYNFGKEGESNWKYLKTCKYEIDKVSGYLMVDRPQKFSNIIPAPYGFIPQTYCGNKVAQHCMEKTGKTNIVGDGDPLDVLVLGPSVERDAVLACKILGILRLKDRGEQDDKLIAVQAGSPLFEANSLDDLSNNFNGTLSTTVFDKKKIEKYSF